LRRLEDGTKFQDEQDVFDGNNNSNEDIGTMEDDKMIVDDDSDRPRPEHDDLGVDGTAAEVSMPRIVLSFSSDEYDLSEKEYGQFVEDMVGDAILDAMKDDFQNLIMDIRTEFGVNRGVSGSKAAVFCKGRAYFSPTNVPSEMELAEIVSFRLNDVEVQRLFDQSEDFDGVGNVKIVIGDEDYFPDLVPTILADEAGAGINGLAIWLSATLCILIVAFAGVILMRRHEARRRANDETIVLKPSPWGVHG